MKFNKKILVLVILAFFIFISAAFSAYNEQNTYNGNVIVDNTNSTDIGCCSIVLQLEGNDTIFAYRRDSNITADVHIEQVDWHGKSAIKQYKTEDGYFCHVIVTSDGWVIGLGGIDDGEDNKKCEKIAAKLISDDYSISESYLEEIQEIKKPYGRGHILIKAPNGNYGFATVDKVKTGKLEPGRYISLPNNYSYSRGDDFSLKTHDKIKLVNELAQSDKYGVDRREIVTYDFQSGEISNKTNIYVSNEDGSQLGIDYTDCVDDVYVNKSIIKSEDIPIAPKYKQIDSISFINENSNNYKLSVLIMLVITAVSVGVISFASFKIVRGVRSRFRR